MTPSAQDGMIYAGSDGGMEFTVDQTSNLNLSQSSKNMQARSFKGTAAGNERKSTFEKIIQDSASGYNSMVSAGSRPIVKSNSRQMSRKNKVILPKIMFYNQSTYAKQQENSASGLLNHTAMESQSRALSNERASNGEDSSPHYMTVNRSQLIHYQDSMDSIPLPATSEAQK